MPIHHQSDHIVPWSAVPAQAIAQVCELTWQLRGEAGDRQVKGAKVGITANQGLFHLEREAQGVEHLDRFGHDFGADAVTRKNCDFHEGA